MSQDRPAPPIPARPGSAPRSRGVHHLLATSTSRYHRNRCLDALRNGGYDITALESPADIAARARHVRDIWTGDCTGNLRSAPGRHVARTGDRLPLAADVLQRNRATGRKSVAT